MQWVKGLRAEIGQYGYQNVQNFILIPNLKTKLKKRATIESYLKKLEIKQFLEDNFFVVFFSILPLSLESL